MQKSGYVQSLNKTDIYYQIHPTQETPKAIIVIIHGLTGNSENYKGFIQHFNNEGYALVSFDLPGHGKSGGKKNHIQNYSEYNSVLLHIIEMTKEYFQGQLTFLLGHSIGGLITTDFLIEHSDLVDGALLSGPCLSMKREIPKRYYYTGVVISKLFPALPLMKISCMQKKKIAGCALRSSEFISARFAIETLKTMERVQSSSHQITTPIIILHGEKDSVISPDGSKQLYETVASEDKTLRIYPETSHEFLADSTSLVYSEIEDWLSTRITSKETLCC